MFSLKSYIGTFDSIFFIYSVGETQLNNSLTNLHTWYDSFDPLNILFSIVSEYMI